MSPLSGEGRPLPGERAVTVEESRCAEALRGLRARSGLSLKALAAETSYSKSSWERYLNGKSRPPREAVVALCRVAGEAPAHCLALWDLAEESKSRASGGAVPVSDRASGPGPGLASAHAPGPASDPVATPAPAPESVRVPHVPVPGPDSGAASASTPPRSPWGPRSPYARAAAVLVALLGTTVLITAHVKEPENIPPQEPEFACHGPGCAGRDVIATRCGMHPDTVSTHRPRPGIRIDLRHEEGCGAGWARVWGQRIGDSVTVSAGGGEPQRLTVPDKYATGLRLHTPMVATDDPAALRVCVTLASDGTERCFPDEAATTPRETP